MGLAWCNKITVGKTSQKAKKHVKVITSGKDLDKLLARQQTGRGIAELPKEPKQLAKVMKMLQGKVELEDDEVLILVDSGSNINCAKVARDFKKYKGCVVPSSGSRRGDVATTACGAQMKNRGKCVISGVADGQKVSIPFQDMDVELPILSVRQSVKSGQRVSFFEGGGELKDTNTGKCIQIHEIEDTYFMKLKVSPPSDEQLSLADFARQER